MFVGGSTKKNRIFGIFCVWEDSCYGINDYLRLTIETVWTDSISRR